MAEESESQSREGRMPEGSIAIQGTVSLPGGKKGDEEIPKDSHVTTRHVYSADGSELSYDATVGTISIETKDAKPASSMFHLDFVKVDPESGKVDSARPVTFVFNGGPGSSTTFLMMGSFGPKRVDTGDRVEGTGAPYRLIDNPYSILPFSDIVFIDAPGAGWSRIAEKAKKELWGVDGDLFAFSQFIRRWLVLNHRWNSPKYLFGESYGTVRGAGLSYRLQQDGVNLTGITLISNILDYSYVYDRSDQSYVGFFPTYATTAWYHGKAGKGLTLEQQAQKARIFANGPYRQALSYGDSLPQEAKNRIASEYAHLTGLSADYVRRANLRVSVERFTKELLRDEGKIVGAYDSRVTGYDLDGVRSDVTYLIDDGRLDPAYTASAEYYLRDELGWKDHDLRRGFADFDLDGVEPGKSWKWTHKLPEGSRDGWDGEYVQFPAMVEDLAAAIVHEPGLKVLFGNGLYDTCTPFFNTEHDADHMQLPPALRSHIAFTYYPSGHMIYTAPKALPKLVADLRKFYELDASQLQQINERPQLPYPGESASDAQ